MFTVVSITVIVVMMLTLARALLGPTVYDRILAVNSFGTLTVLLISVHGFLIDRLEFLDIALVYVFINFIATIAVTKFVKYRHLGHPAKEDHRGDV